jgi:hypothetical protein
MKNYFITKSTGHSLFLFIKKQVWFEHAPQLQELMPCLMPFPSPSSTTRRSSSHHRKAPVITQDHIHVSNISAFLIDRRSLNLFLDWSGANVLAVERFH